MKLIRSVLGMLVLAGLLLSGSNVLALNIVITNDDGFETTLTNTLYQTLKSAGHDVIISAPYENQSGRSSAVYLWETIQNVDHDSKKRTIVASPDSPAPGIGQHPGDPDINYVNGTPVMAVAYGIDVVAQRRWGGAPNLVISGPNQGWNTGKITNYSGTVGAAVHSLRHGIPAIAVSTHYFTKYDDALTPEIADIVVNIVKELQDNAGEGPLLPNGIGLNVNIPLFAQGQGASTPVRFTQVGSHAGWDDDGAFEGWDIKFYPDLADDPAFGAYYSGPGIGGVYPQRANETNPNAEGLHVGTTTNPGDITISTIDGDYNAEKQMENLVKKRLKNLSRNSKSLAR